ncbi:MAG TPA: hypothetical protein VGL95_14490, partial [Acetobacteraceae bacterium]
SVSDVVAALVDPLSAIRAAVQQTALVMSGDAHVFEAFMPTDVNQPIQLVVGTGGDKLEKADMLGDDPTKPKPATMFGRTGTLTGKVEFGFVLLTREPHGWTATLHDVQGNPVLQCELSARTCSPSASAP